VGADARSVHANAARGVSPNHDCHGKTTAEETPMANLDSKTAVWI
jgi:hypothetical protein